MRRLLLALILVAGTVPALSATAPASYVPPEADRLLWCGSAFYWLSIDASDAGNNKEAEEYQAWSDQLLDRAATLLAAAGLDAPATDDLISSYADRALDEGIVQALWLRPEELRGQHVRHRSPLVWRVVEDFLGGRRHPLDALHQMP